MPRTLPALAAFVLDAALVTAFAAVGRASHDSTPVGVGLWTTAWPFLAALALGWLVTRGWRRPAAAVRTGVPVGAITVAGGMLLRAASGQGTAVAFVLVATAMLLVLLVGWRAVVALAGAIGRRRARR